MPLLSTTLSTTATDGCARMVPFSLVDADGKVIVKDKHLLSLKDMNQSDELEQLLDAGADVYKRQDL